MLVSSIKQKCLLITLCKILLQVFPLLFFEGFYEIVLFVSRKNLVSIIGKCSYISTDIIFISMEECYCKPKY